MTLFPLTDHRLIDIDSIAYVEAEFPESHDDAHVGDGECRKCPYRLVISFKQPIGYKSNVAMGTRLPLSALTLTGADAEIAWSRLETQA